MSKEVHNLKDADLIKQLKAESELKTKWLSLIAHDFRGLFSNIRMLLNGFDNGSISQDTLIGMLAEIKQIADKNSKTLESTFAWVNTQIDGFNPIIEEIDLYSFFQILKEELKAEIDLKRISLKYSGEKDLKLRSDRFLLTFILKQTIGNAIKYSYEGGEVRMIVSKESEGCTILIEDYGMGMNKRVQENLYTLNGCPYLGSMHEKGAGLSLVVIKDFVEKLGAKMDVSSTIGEGTTVTFIFDENKI
ncbi:MAG: HAMP domain-containing sensor histidine kinase [Dysgonamonadaceae bacterium]|nr:HAMP domain-containing sensor histidine kinase [Dysgonamonadaceae bacterium]